MNRRVCHIGPELSHIIMGYRKSYQLNEHLSKFSNVCSILCDVKLVTMIKLL